MAKNKELKQIEKQEKKKERDNKSKSKDPKKKGKDVKYVKKHPRPETTLTSGDANTSADSDDTVCPGCSLVCKNDPGGLWHGSAATTVTVKRGIASIAQEYQTKRTFLNIITVPHVSEYSTVTL